MNTHPSPQTLRLQSAFKVALSMVLCYWYVLWMDWGYTHYGAYAIIFCSLDTTGASVEKGLMRFVGTCVGILVAFVLIGCIGDNRWLMMAAMAVYLVGVGWGIQTSRYTYAWYVGGFVPLVVWSSNYPHFETAFSFGVYRWLETVAGIVSYSIVDVLLWPRSSGQQLRINAQPLWDQVIELFKETRDQLRQSEVKSVAALRGKIANRYAEVDFDLQQATLDTPQVASHRKTWAEVRKLGTAFFVHLELWRESVIDCRHLSLGEVLPEMDKVVDRIERRLEQVHLLWSEALRDSRPLLQDNGAGAESKVDLTVLPTDEVKPVASVFQAMPSAHRAAVQNLAHRLDVLDQDTDRLVRRLRVLAELDRQADLPQALVEEAEPVYWPRIWNVDRFVTGLYPAIAFVSAFLFWIYFQPPTGAGQVQMTGTLSLMVLRQRMNPVALTVVFVLTFLVIVAPMVWVVMPALNTPEELLTLVFVYTFVFCYWGAKTPVLKIAPLAAFVTVAQISNSQHYSFQLTTDSALMILLAGPFLSISWYLVTPMRPEKALLRALERFRQGCARICNGFIDGDERTRRDALEMMVLPAAGAIRGVQGNLRISKLNPEESEQQLNDLLDGVQHVSSQLIATQNAYRRTEEMQAVIPGRMRELNQVAGQVNTAAQDLFAHWSHFESSKEWSGADPSTSAAVEQLEEAINQMAIRHAASETNAEVADLRNDSPASSSFRAALDAYYILLGSLRGLVRALANVNRVIDRIDWPGITASRF